MLNENNTLPRKNRLTKTSEYQKVYEQGQRLRGGTYSLIFAPNTKNTSRIGISVHGCKGAVKRNRIKRIIREFYRLNRSIMPSAMDIVFTVRQGFSFESPQDIGKSVSNLLKKAVMANGNMRS
jgi:ribonuclease P protein component